MEKPPLIRFIEEHYGRKPPTEHTCTSSVSPHALKDGSSIVIIGGGIAGPAFARRILSSAVERGIRLSVTLLSRPNCNYCGGLITDLSLETMRGLYSFEPPPEVVLTRIDEAVLINPHGSASVVFESPLASVFRTSRFGELGFDDNFRQNILTGLPEEAGELLSVVEPASATSVEIPGNGRRGAVTFRRIGGSDRVEADLVVLATGLRSLDSKLISGFRELTGFRPPPLMPACVTEIDLSGTGTSHIGRRVLILNGIIEGCVAALIPKRPNWITIAALHKVLTIEDLRRIFEHPVVTQYVEVEEVESSLPCNKVCPSGVYTSPARNFYGDGWAVVGDLTGYGRVLKDGYFAALLGADLAAHTAISHGCSREAFARHYHAGLKAFEGDNRIGMRLFSLNNALTRLEAFNRAMIDAFSAEKAGHPYGGLTHAAFRALSTGELSYSGVLMLFAAGLLSWAIKHPIRALSSLRGGKRQL